jgi:CRP-like cAMP-binding protein
MISPELVRRYPFFWCIDDAQQKAIAMIAEDVTLSEGTMIFEENQPATALYLLMEGSVTLCIMAGSEGDKKPSHLHVGDINPGEPFGISAMLAGETYTSCAQATAKSRVLKVDADELKKLMAAKPSLGYCLVQQMGKAALERLRLTHIQLAAAQS